MTAKTDGQQKMWACFDEIERYCRAQEGDKFGRIEPIFSALRTALEQAEEALADMKVCESCERTVGQEVPETMICTRCHNSLARRMEQAECERDKARGLLREAGMWLPPERTKLIERIDAHLRDTGD